MNEITIEKLNQTLLKIEIILQNKIDHSMTIIFSFILAIQLNNPSITKVFHCFSSKNNFIILDNSFNNAKKSKLFLQRNERNRLSIHFYTI